MQIIVVERKKQIEIQEQEIARRERELEAQVKRPAMAEKYKIETIAEANKNKAILEAEAKATSIATKAEAEAFAIEAKAKAEAKAMQQKADAFREYGKAAIFEKVLEVLPKVAAEVAAPITQTNRIVFVAGPNGDIGASRLTAEVQQIIEQLPVTIDKMIGLDVTKLLKSATSATA
eukprot:Colp12_sorted_trinity150504_noHs@31760